MAGQRPEKRLAEHGALTCCLLTQVARKQLPAPRRRACALKEQKCEGGRRKKNLSLITLCLYRAPTNAQQVAPETRKKKNKANNSLFASQKQYTMHCHALLCSSPPRPSSSHAPASCLPRTRRWLFCFTKQSISLSILTSKTHTANHRREPRHWLLLACLSHAALKAKLSAEFDK